MVNYIFDPEEKEYVKVARPYPHSVGIMVNRFSRRRYTDAGQN